MTKLTHSAFFKLAALLREKNRVDEQIAAIVGRPAEKGHLGEIIASNLFDIELESSATNAGYDGRFREGPLAGKTVNVKWYAKREGLLDINTASLPDYWLVLAGPPAAAATSRGTTRPWLVNEVFLFDAAALLPALRGRNVKIGIATSVTKAEWDRARIFPEPHNPTIAISDAAKRLMAVLGPPPQEPVRGPTRFFSGRPLAGRRDVIPLLADGEYQWKEKYSAYELATAWFDAGDIPPAVRATLDSVPAYRGAEMIEAFFERPVELGTPGRPSQTDLLALVSCSSGYAVLAVEGKADESFGERVRDWKAKTTRWEPRLSALCATLGLDTASVEPLRYQLLHRAASAVYEAQRYRAHDAMMIVHSFSSAGENDANKKDFEAFSQAMGLPLREGTVTEAKACDGVNLRLAWVSDRASGSATK